VSSRGRPLPGDVGGADRGGPATVEPDAQAENEQSERSALTRSGWLVQRIVDERVHLIVAIGRGELATRNCRWLRFPRGTAGEPGTHSAEHRSVGSGGALLGQAGHKSFDGVGIEDDFAVERHALGRCPSCETHEQPSGSKTTRVVG
jgi:hypothetical protein